MTRRCLIAMLAACHGPPHHSPIDAAIDAMVDAPIGMGVHHHYVIDHDYVPTNHVQALQYALDLNGDGSADNDLGEVLSFFHGQGLDTQAFASSQIDNGSILMLADLQASDLANATGAAFTLYEGADPIPAPCSNMTDTVCRKHLTGSGMFTAKTSPRDGPITGSIVGGTFTSDAGHLSIELAFVGAIVPLTVVGARVKLVPSGTGVMSGVIAGGMTTADRDNKLYPAFAQAMAARVATDCGVTRALPSCGCPAGSLGSTFLSWFDMSPRDCNISVGEVANNSTLQSLLLPDLTLENQPVLSLGFGITAVEGFFSP